MEKKVKIQSKISGAIFEFETLDAALRSLKGTEPTGDKFNDILLSVSSRRTFKEANSLLERNGWTLFREPETKVKSIEKTKIKTKYSDGAFEISMTNEDDEYVTMRIDTSDFKIKYVEGGLEIKFKR